MSGLFGIVSKSDCSENLIYGIDYHTHMGSEYGGIAILNDEFTRYINRMSNANFRDRFFSSDKKIETTKGIGCISDLEEQPIYIKSRVGEFCVVTSGRVENLQEIADSMIKEGICFSEFSKSHVNTTELVARIVASGSSIQEGIKLVYKKIKGSCSLLILTREGIYAARDFYGRTSLILGKNEDSYAVCSETVAFANLGFEQIRDLNSGEIVLINENGIKVLEKGHKTKQICTFLWIYTGFPASNYEGLNSEVIREKSGKLLAKRDKGIKADLVSGVPDSGLAHAIGYAIESGIPYRRALVKYTPTYGRSYAPRTQKLRNLTAKMKLIAIKEIIQGNSVILLEDSIVRGTQLKNFTVEKIWNCGAKEIHVRPACPPLMFPCSYCNSTRTNSELITRRAIKEIEGKDIEDVSEYLDHTSEKYAKMIEWIRKYLNITSLKYQTLEDMVQAIGLPEENLCTFCWNGKNCQKCKG
ncbi:amidophosphoribosyltransferase [Candidatus Ruminimicrobium bovinum]|uniref:amidophosphoribosyltransferase n=1 Tax=Candidatus Ruminimicrobium bovinum TaxID=3242779 RepID=UPI0039B8EA41